MDEDVWRTRQSQLTRLQRGRYMPMWFERPDAVPNARNYSLLVDEQHGKYYALLYMLPNGHALGMPIQTRGNLKRLGVPSTSAPGEYTAPILNLTPRSRSAILLPLEMGLWHVEEFLTHPDANVRTAFLFERNGAYFLNVSFEYTVRALLPETVIGVDRGVAQLMAVRVLGPEGQVLHEELWSGDEFLTFQWDYKKTLRRLQKRGKDVTGFVKVRRVSEHTTHAIANRIAELAAQYRGQVVIENLRRLDKYKEKFYRLRATPYQAIAAKLEYKLPLKGLPKPRFVSAAYTSQMCARCGYADKANRPTQEQFMCQACGHTDHADLNAASNIARRWLARANGSDWWPPNIERKEQTDVE